MSKHRSPKIEDLAYDFLQSHYSATYTATTIHVKRKVKTKANAETDGLLLFDTIDNSPFCAAVVTATSSTLCRLLTSYKKNGLSRYRFISAGLVLGAVAILLYGVLPVAFVTAIALAAFLVTLVMHSILEKNRLKKKIRVVVDNLNNFPANEQWLGISVSSLTFRNNALALYFTSLCRERGIGIITVGLRAKVVLLQEPKAVQSRGENFVTNYVIEAEAKPALDIKPADANLRVA